MKKNILLLITSLILFMAADAKAQQGCAEDLCCYEEECCIPETNFYAKIFGGANFLQNTSVNGNKSTYQTGYIAAGSLGYCWRCGLCLEAEYAFRRNAIQQIHLFGEGSSKHGHFQASSYMANVLWNLPLCSSENAFGNIQSFLGAGIGYDFQQMHASNSRFDFNQRWNHFSWQVMAGLACSLFYNTEITLEYKFHQGGCHFNNHSVGLGLVYKFSCLH